MSTVVRRAGSTAEAPAALLRTRGGTWHVIVGGTLRTACGAPVRARVSSDRVRLDELPAGQALCGRCAHWYREVTS